MLPPGFTAPTSGQTTDTNADTGFNLAATVKDTDDLSTLVNEGSVDFVIEDSHGSVVAEHDGVAVQNGVANDTNEFYLPAGIGYQVVADYVLASTPHFYTSSSAARHFDLSFGDSTAAHRPTSKATALTSGPGLTGATAELATAVPGEPVRCVHRKVTEHGGPDGQVAAGFLGGPEDRRGSVAALP